MQHCCSVRQAKNSLACHCNYTYEVLQFIQPYSDPSQINSNHPWDPVHAHCSTAALQGKLRTALLVTAITPMRFCKSFKPYSDPSQMHSNHPTVPVHALCSTAALQGKLRTALLVTASKPVRFCSSFKPTVTHHRCTATIPGILCMLSAALLLCKAS